MPFKRPNFEVRPSARFARAVLLLLSTLLLAAPALAATYYISPSGNDGSPGTQGSPWRTLAKANSTLVAGDAVWIADGSYADAVQPVNNGNAVARIRYIGDIANPSAVVTPSIYIDKAYVTVLGIKATTNYLLYYVNETSKAWFDSTSYCNIPGVSIWGAQDCMISHCVSTGESAILQDKGYAGPPDPAISSPARDTLRDNHFTVPQVNTKGFALRGDAQYCLFERNTFDVFFAVAHGGDCQGRYLYNAYYNTFRDNRWNFEADGELYDGSTPPNPSQFTAYALRDSSSYNLFERDSIYAGVQNGFDIGGRLVNAGNAAWVGQCVGNHWKGCVFRTTGFTFTQDLLNGALIENCVFASNHNYPLWLLSNMQNTVIRNCSFFAWQNSAIKVEGDIRLGGNQLYSNIFVADSVAACFSGMPVLFHGWGTGFSEDYNLFYARTATAGVTASSQAVYWASSACSAVGPGTNWANSSGNDGNSKWGSPQFVNTSWAAFDAHLLASSKAIGVGQGGVDAGAYPFVPAGGDVTPPATVSNLTVVQRSNTYALLAWSAPGDNGSVGTCAGYDLRYSTSPITDDASFTSAAQVPTAPAVLSAGGAQSYALTGLSASTTYYFAIKAVDAAGNWSALSDVPSTTTTATDQLAPGRVGDLRAP